MNLRRCMFRGLLLSLAVFVLAAGCRSTPITGRKQLLLVPEQQEIAMGLTAYEDAKTKEPLSTDAKNIAVVTRVGQRIAQAADRPDYKWEFRLIASNEQNAYCLPGGKVTVNEGILPVCANEAGLAVVMSHEISHALARHGGERMSQNMAVDGVKQAVTYFTKDRDERQKELILQAYGIGTQYGVILPYSRTHESEADHMGLILLAKAGYDPTEAPRFWQRFAKLKEGSNPPEFMSTHPSDEHRSEKLTELLPDALAIYNQLPSKYGLGEPLVATPAASLAAKPAAQPAASGYQPLLPRAGAGQNASLFPPPFVPQGR